MAWVKLDDGFFNNQKIVSVSKDAKLIYLAALCHAGATLSDGFIPRNAVVILAAQCDVRAANKAVGDLVSAGLWIPIDGGFTIHDYLEHNTSSQTIQAKRDAAKERMQRNRSQNVRANNERSSQNVRPTKETETETETETEKKTPIPPKPKVEDDPRFIEFWDSYPKKRSKQDAVRAFSGVDWRKVEFADLMAALEQHKASEQWVKDGGEYIPYPGTWLNKRRWTDELAPPVHKPKPPNEPQSYSSDPDEAERQMRRDLEQLKNQSSQSGNGVITMLRREA